MFGHFSRLRTKVLIQFLSIKLETLKSVKNDKIRNNQSQNDMFRGRSRTAATSKIEFFVIIVNGFQPLATIMLKCSILDVASILDPPLMLTLRS